jgi:ATP-dependent helicase YprA (DUF1998 family)
MCNGHFRAHSATTQKARNVKSRKDRESVSKPPLSLHLPKLMLRSGAPESLPDPPNDYKRILEQAREHARQKPETAPEWSPDATQRMHNEFKRLTGRDMYSWQSDTAEGSMLGLDSTLIAPTGAGKTVVPIAPLLASPHKYKMVLILSPLKELQRDQVRSSIVEI